MVGEQLLVAAAAAARFVLAGRLLAAFTGNKFPKSAYTKLLSQDTIPLRFMVMMTGLRILQY